MFNRMAWWTGLVAAAVFLLHDGVAHAQELEPRRWSHLPTDMNFARARFGYTWGDIAFDPLLELEDVTLDLQTVAAKVLRTLSLLNHSARVDLSVPYQDARWKGLLEGEPASTARQGFADPSIRFSMTLAGGPPLKGMEFARPPTLEAEEFVGCVGQRQGHRQRIE